MIPSSSSKEATVEFQEASLDPDQLEPGSGRRALHMKRPPGQEASRRSARSREREAWALVLDQVVALEEDAHGNKGSDRHPGPKPRFCAERVSPITLPAAARSACAPGAADGSSVYATGERVRHVQSVRRMSLAHCHVPPFLGQSTPDFAGR